MPSQYDFTQWDPMVYPNITFNGKNSLTDMGVMVTGITQLSTISPKTKYEELQFSDGRISETFVDGDRYFDPREWAVTFQFFIKHNGTNTSNSQANAKLNDIYKWLTEKGDGIYKESGNAGFMLINTECKGFDKPEKKWYADALQVDITANFISDPLWISEDGIIMEISNFMITSTKNSPAYGYFSHERQQDGSIIGNFSMEPQGRIFTNANGYNGSPYLYYVRGTDTTSPPTGSDTGWFEIYIPLGASYANKQVSFKANRVLQYSSTISMSTIIKESEIVELYRYDGYSLTNVTGNRGTVTADSSGVIRFYCRNANGYTYSNGINAIEMMLYLGNSYTIPADAEINFRLKAYTRANIQVAVTSLDGQTGGEVDPKGFTVPDGESRLIIYGTGDSIMGYSGYYRLYFDNTERRL